MTPLLNLVRSAALVLVGRRLGLRAAARRDAGQATAEYAIVVVGAALVGFLLISWATGGDGAGKVGDLLNGVIDEVADQVG